MRDIKEIEKDIQAAKDGKYFEKSQQFVSVLICMAISYTLTEWVKSTVTPVAGNICGGCSALIVMALGKISSRYIENGVKSYFFEPLTNKLVRPMLEAEKEQAEKENSLFSRLERWMRS